MLAALIALGVFTALARPVAAGPVLTNGIRLIERHYLFDDQLEPGRLLGETLEYLESRLDTVQATETAYGGYVLSASGCELHLETRPGQELTALIEPLEHAAALLEDCAGPLPKDTPGPDSLLLAGILSGLDPYSSILNLQRKTEHSIQFSGKLAGIGARIGIRDNRLVLIKVYKVAPAWKAGLRDGDFVVRIDGLSATNIQVSDAVQRIRGPVGTKVQITVQREDEPEPIPIMVTRDVVRIPSVEAEMLEGGVVHARITHFSQTTPKDFSERVGEFAEEGQLSGVVIDLRGNSGGSMLGSSAIGDLFLDTGVLITTAGRNGKRVSGLMPIIEAGTDTPFSLLPVIFLTSPRTASGSELLAAGVRSNGRALIIGEPTYGKGTVQKTYSLTRDTSIKMTVGRFLPNGEVLPGGGLTPDVELRTYHISEDGVRSPAVADDEELPFWLQSPSWLPQPQQFDHLTLTYVQDSSQDQNDHTLELARLMIVQHGSTSATLMLDNAREFLDTIKQSSIAEVETAMEGLGLDWSSSAEVNSDTSHETVSLRLDIEGEPLRAGVEGKLAFVLTNTGTRTLQRVGGMLDSNGFWLDKRSLLFGRLEPGGQRRWEIPVKPPARTRTGRIKASVTIIEGQRKIAEFGPLLIGVSNNGRPRLAFRSSLSTEAQDQGAMNIVVEVENRGDSAAKNVRVLLRNPLSSVYEIVMGTGTTEVLEPGGRKSFPLTVRMTESYATIPQVELVVSESSTFTVLETTLDIATTRGFSSWREPPQINIVHIPPTANGDGRRLLAQVTDDRGLVTVITRIDGKKTDLLETRGRPSRVIDLPLGWEPRGKLHLIEITATDTDGLTTNYVSTP